MPQVPAATRALRVLRLLAAQPDPVTLDRLASVVGLPRSTAYHLLNAMIEEGFVVHLADDHRYGLGVAAFEVGSGFSRQEPLQRISGRAIRSALQAAQVRALYPDASAFVERHGTGPRTLSALRSVLTETRRRG